MRRIAEIFGISLKKQPYMDNMTISVPSEPIWILGRRESSGQLFWRRDSSKVKFRCDVEVLEYVKDPAEHIQHQYDSDSLNKTNFLIVCATCAAALAVTVVLPWFLMGSS